MTIKTSASLVQRNRPAFVEIEVAGKSFPRKQILFPEKSKINHVFHILKSAKKLDGEESRTVLLNGNEVIPSNCMPNSREVFVHTCFDEEVRIECSGVDEAYVLEDGVALSLLTAIISYFDRQLLGNNMSFTPCSIHILLIPNKCNKFWMSCGRRN